MLIVMALNLAAKSAPIPPGKQPSSANPPEGSNITDTDQVLIYNTPEDMEMGVRPFFECPMSREEAEKTLQRALDMLRHKPEPSRGRNFTAEAKILLRGMTCDPTIGSSSADSSQSPVKQREDPEYCEIELRGGTRLKIRESTKKHILHLHDVKGYDEASIKAQIMHSSSVPIVVSTFV